MSDSDPWGYDAPGAGGTLTPAGGGAAEDDSLDATLDGKFADFRKVGGVRQQVLDNFVRMIDADPEAIVNALRQVINSGAPPSSGGRE
ncbi:MAG: hypothetical protein AAF684_00660 [Pseudomonadota bacterium]